MDYRAQRWERMISAVVQRNVVIRDPSENAKSVQSSGQRGAKGAASDHGARLHSRGQKIVKITFTNIHSCLYK